MNIAALADEHLLLNVDFKVVIRLKYKPRVDVMLNVCHNQ